MTANATRGARRWRGVAAGTTAALAAPAALTRAGLRILMRDAGPPRADARPDDELALALGSAARAIALLAGASARVGAAGLWRNSCLYRSVAQCLVLRAYGRRARVALGAGQLPGGAVGAHAWVVYGGPEPVERPAPEFVTFRATAS